MFEETNVIIKRFGSNKILCIKEAFAIGKIRFEFVEFDKKQKSGSKASKTIITYMDVEKFLVLCNYLETGRIYGMLNSKKAEQAATGSKQPKPAFEDYGGRSEANGKAQSRIFAITSGDRFPIIIKASEGPGRVGSNGQIIPSYKEWNPSNSKTTNFPLTDELAVAIGIAGRRSVDIYDKWLAAGVDVLKKNLDRIAPKQQEQKGQQAPQQRQAAQAPQQRPQQRQAVQAPQQRPQQRQAAQAPQQTPRQMQMPQAPQQRPQRGPMVTSSYEPDYRAEGHYLNGRQPYDGQSNGRYREIRVDESRDSRYIW